MIETDKQARELAKKVVKESDGVVKFGCTNGRRCLHVRFTARPAAGNEIGSQQAADSITIYDEAEWDNSAHNINNRPRRKRYEDAVIAQGVIEAVANKEAQ